MDAKIVKKFMELFKGLDYAHGIFTPDKLEGKKQTGKCTTIKELTTEEHWKDHLEGKIGLGIIPISEGNICSWAVVDIDDYGLDTMEIIIRTQNHPFVVCRSKSGGFHLFIFFKEPASCKKVREYLRGQVSVLGLGNSEVFPKQDEIISKRGDVGNWLNMPYFGDTRKCVVIKHNNVYELKPMEFLEYVSHKKILIDDILEKSEKIDYEKSPIKEGPPCLQVLSLKGFPTGTRNNSLFNIGVYLKKASPNNWARLLEEYNRKLFKEPLLGKEVAVVIKSLDKKEYFYQCYEEPLSSFCNAKLCRTRKWGISSVTSMPIINSVTKVAGDFSMWFIDVEGGRLELTTEELFDNRKFVMKCINSLNILPNQMAKAPWHAFLQNILDKAIIISDENMFKRHEVPDQFAQFLLSRVTEVDLEIHQGRVIYNKDKREVQFKIESFLNYMKYKKVQIDRGWVVMFLKARGAKTGVGKDRDRKSFRYTSIVLNDDEVVEVDNKLRMRNVV